MYNLKNCIDLYNVYLLLVDYDRVKGFGKAGKGGNSDGIGGGTLVGGGSGLP
jgi:hypothetical protein